MYEQPEVVVIPIFEDDKETDGTKSSNDLAKQTTELKEQGDTESLYRRVKEVAHFVDEDKIKIWQEGGNDLDEEDKAILDEFLPRTGDVHCMWENIINGDLDSVKNWIEKASKEEINKCDSHNGLNALHYSIIFKKTELVETLLESGAAPDYSSEDGNLLPLHLTLLGLTSFSDAIRLLINHKADVNMPSKKHVGGEPSAGTLDNRIYNDTGTSGISRSGGPLNGEKQGVCQGGCSIKDITTVKSTTITFQCGKSITRDLCVKCQKLPCTEDCPDCGRNCQAQ